MDLVFHLWILKGKIASVGARIGEEEVGEGKGIEGFEGREKLKEERIVI